MEAADNIIIRQLDLIKYPKVQAIGHIDELSYGKFVDIIVFLMRKIPSVAERITDPPANNKGALKYATSLIPPISSLGFEGELNYDHFLYPKGEKSRTLIRFLLGKVPQTETTRTQTATSVSVLSQAIQSTQQEFVAALKNKQSRTPIAQPLTVVNRSIDGPTKEKVFAISAEPKISFLSVPILRSPAFSNQCGINSLASLLAANDREANIDFETEAPARVHHLATVSGRAFTFTTTEIAAPAIVKSSTQHLQTKTRLANEVRFKFQQSDIKRGATAAVPRVSAGDLSSLSKSDKTAEKSEKSADEQGETKEGQAKSEEPKEPYLTYQEVKEIKEKQRQEIEETSSLIPAIEAEIVNFEMSRDRDREEIGKLQTSLAALTTQSEALETETEKAVSSAKYANSSVENIKVLRQQTVQSTSELLNIAAQWEQKRTQLIRQYRDLASAIRHRNDDRELVKAKLAKLKKQIAEGDEKLQNAEESIQDLTQALATRGDQLKRHHYTEMIFEMIKKIQKQEAEVEKVREEIRAQHTKMNSTIETVKRTWQLVDETIYSEAKKKPEQWIRQSYKMVVELLTLFENISEDVEKSGKMSAMMMELEAKIERVQEQSDPKALDKILNDLQEIKMEIHRRQDQQG